MYRYGHNTSVTNHQTHLLTEHNIMPANKAFMSNQRILTDMFSTSTDTEIGCIATKKKKVDPREREQFCLNRQFVLWICKALLPFDTIENIGFVNLWGWLRQSSVVPDAFELPSRTTMSVGALNDVYLCYKAKLIDILKNSCEHGTMTLDAWTDKYKRTAYITFTYHYMDNWQIKTVVLKTGSFPHPHTGVRVHDEIESI